VFVKYIKIARQLQVYAPNLNYVIRSNVVMINELQKEENFDLKIRKNDMNTQSTKNELVNRKSRERSRKKKSLISILMKRSVKCSKKKKQLMKSKELFMTSSLKRLVERLRKIILDTSLSSKVNTQLTFEEHQVNNVSTLKEH